MNQSQSYPDGFAPDNEISFVEIVCAILRNWRMIAVLPVTLALVIGLYTLAQDRTYSATASFIPQTMEGRNGSGAAVLAQQFGFSLGTERPGQSPQFFADLLMSITILRNAVESEYQVLEQGAARTATLIEVYAIQDRGAVPAWRKAVEQLRDDMSVFVVRETGIVRLTVSAGNPSVSEQVAQRILELLNEFNLEARQSRALEEGRFISGRVTEAQAELLGAEGALQEFLRQNRDFRNSPELQFDHDRMQREVAMRQEVYTSLLRAQEEARIDAVRDTPLLTVIESPIGAAEPDGRRIVLRTLLAFLLGLMIAVIVAFIAEFVRRNRETGDPHYRELEGLARQAWEDMRRPGRWIERPDKRVAAGGDSSGGGTA
jgi:uncharacterized protein involved in exopolysaccharide biosynthesis